VRTRFLAAAVVSLGMFAACSTACSPAASPSSTADGGSVDSTSDAGAVDGVAPVDGGAIPTTDGSIGGRDWTAFPAVAMVSGATEIDAISDVHGDPDTMIALLVAANLVSPATPHAWTGGTKVLVVTGDTIDKGTHALATIDLLIALEAGARAAGGRVLATLGNHEAEFLADPASTKTTDFQTELTKAGLTPAKVAAGDSPYGGWLRTRPLAAVVDEWFFSHAGNAGGKTVPQLAAQFQSLFVQNAFADPFFVGADSILEAREWWNASSSATQTIDQDLGALGVKHIVFGHSPTKISFPDDPQGDRAKGTMAMRYAGRLFLIDTGMSYAVAYSTGSLLRIARGATTTATAVHRDGTPETLWTGP
jgi:Calcineurin-like phosphoesterase